MLTVSARSAGSRRPLLDEWCVPLPDSLQGESVRLRDVIEVIVRREVEEFRKRQRERRLFRVLTAREIEEQAERGKVAPGSSDVPEQRVDADEAVRTALEAFDDGLYLVIIDGRQITELDAPVEVGPDSRIVFIRLVFLAGG